VLEPFFLDEELEDVVAVGPALRVVLLEDTGM
jgi:hypothetical protein